MAEPDLWTGRSRPHGDCRTAVAVKEEEMRQEAIRAAAARMSRQCVSVIEDALLHWELADAEREFFDLILAGLEELHREKLLDVRGAGENGAR